MASFLWFVIGAQFWVNEQSLLIPPQEVTKQALIHSMHGCIYTKLCWTCEWVIVNACGEITANAISKQKLQL